MKNFFLILIFLLIQFLSINNSHSQNTFNTTVEYCAGTWNQWDPCGHIIIDQILQDYPNTVALAYHGAGSDPWQSYSSGIRNLFGFSSYPSGVVGRKTGIISRDAWYNEVTLQSLLLQPGVSINISSKNYDSQTRILTANVNVTALSNLTGNYYINYILTENNLIYPQTGNSSCTGGSSYIHNHVVKSMLNGDQGELIHSGNWNNGTHVYKNNSFIIPDIPQVMEILNCDLNIIIYKQGSNISTNSNIQQSLKTQVVGNTFSGIRLNLKIIPEGLYSSTFNQLSRKDTVKVYLRNISSPFNLIDSSTSIIDSLTFSGTFQFYFATSANYYVTVNHLNCLETWSKPGGEFLQNGGFSNEFDFTSSKSQAYGDNLKLKGSKYCIYSGDVNQDEFITTFDAILIYNDVINFVTGNYLSTDINGDGLVDLTDKTICYNNSINFVRTIKP